MDQLKETLNIQFSQALRDREKILTSEYLKEKENLLADIRDIDKKLLNANESLNVATHRIEELTLSLNSEIERDNILKE